MNTTKSTITAPAMSRDEWEELPPSVQYFIPWEKARKPLKVKKVKAPDKVRKAHK